MKLSDQTVSQALACVRKVGKLVIAGLLFLFAAPLVAQTTSEFTFSASLRVIPEDAPPNVARTLVVDGMWPSGCIPRAATTRVEETGTTKTVVIVLETPPGVNPCTLAITRFNFSLSYTPTEIGVQPVRIQADFGARGGEGSIKTSNSAGAIFALTPIVNVLPDVDTPNRPRTIVISGQTLTGCPFMTPTIDNVASQISGGVVILMDPVPTFVACATNSLTPYRFELPYTPTAVGTRPVIVASASGIKRSEANIRTAATSTATRAVGDISGVWYDPRTNGSGLSFTHNFAGTDVVFGTAYFYDPSGRARWLTLQNVSWQSGGTAIVADLMETRSVPVLCSPACPDLPSPSVYSTLTKTGTVRITFTGLAPYSDTQPQGFLEATTTTGGLLFRMNLIRIGL